MLFSQPAFLFGFLPIVFATFLACRRFLGGSAATAFLIFASMVFYAWWSVWFLLLLIAQLLANYFAARHLRVRGSRSLLTVMICLNLALLGYFKDRNFFIANLLALVGDYRTLPTLIVPLGISFHTFQQIAFLVSNNGRTAHFPSLKNYALFVLFFPQLVAGPIVLNHEFEPQVEMSQRGWEINWEYIGTGFVIFVYGLFKKVCLADNIAPYVDTAFNPSIHLQPAEAWTAVISFVLQLFFDFSGYTDMAIGLGMMFGIRLPANFQDPLRATSIIDLWARWHITMTRFFMMYVYTPLSMHLTRKSFRRKMSRPALFLITGAFPTMVTFVAAGFWHGANWTFGLFGVTQGIALCINQVWRQWKLWRLPVVLSWAATMMVFCIGQAFFRSQTSAQASDMLAAMFSPWTFRLPTWLALQTDSLHLPLVDYHFFSGATFTADMLFWAILLGALVFLLPNLSVTKVPFRPTFRLAWCTSALIWLAISYVGAPRTFVYFQF